MPFQTDYFVLRTIRNHQAGPATKYIACSLSGQEIVTWALQALDDRNDRENREQLSREQSPKVQVTEALAILSGQGDDIQIFPVTAAGADEFILVAQTKGAGDEAKAQVRRFI